MKDAKKITIIIQRKLDRHLKIVSFKRFVTLRKF